MNTKRKRVAGIEEWGRTAGPLPARSRCLACRAGKKVTDALKTLSDLRGRGETHVTLPAIRQEFERRFGVTLHGWTLQGHFANCLRAPWGRA